MYLVATEYFVLIELATDDINKSNSEIKAWCCSRGKMISVLNIGVTTKFNSEVAGMGIDILNSKWSKPLTDKH